MELNINIPHIRGELLEASVTLKAIFDIRIISIYSPIIPIMPA
jgi:hypothetical protein